MIESVDKTETMSTTARVVEVVLTQLTPYTNYSIQVAVVDEQGVVGPFTDPITVKTLESG